MKFDALISSIKNKLILEMPEFSRTADKKVIDPQGKSLKEFSTEEVSENIVMFHNEKDTFFFPAGFVMVWFFDSPSVLKQSVSIPDYCPPMFPDFVSIRDRFSGRTPINDIWKKRRHTNKEFLNLDKHVVGALRAYVNAETLYIDMVSVRPGWKRNSIATQMVNALKDKWPDRKIDHSGTTKDGLEFLKATGNLAHTRKDGERES